MRSLVLEWVSRFLGVARQAGSLKGSELNESQKVLPPFDEVLLALFEYAGEYGNRLNSPRWVGKVEKVPWANSP
jgi:hypothetical protein